MFAQKGSEKRTTTPMCCNQTHLQGQVCNMVKALLELPTSHFRVPGFKPLALALDNAGEWPIPLLGQHWISASPLAAAITEPALALHLHCSPDPVVPSAA